MRFPGFYNEWKKICIESLITEEKIYTSDFEKYPLHSFTIELGIIPKTERYERGFLIKKDGNLFKVVQQNDFVMNPMNLRFGAINYSKVSKSISVSGYYNIFRIDNCKFNDFWNAYFKTPKILNLYNSIATGSLVEKKRVHFSQFKKIKMYMPCELEKQKIDTLIKLLDLRIETQSKIIENLYSQRKCIFLQLNNNYQHNKIKINELGPVSIANNLSKDDLVDDGRECILYGELFTKYDLYTTHVISKTNKTYHTITSSGNDLLFPTSTTVNAISLIKPLALCQKDVILGGDMFSIKLNDTYDAIYISCLINYVYKKQLASKTQGTTIVHLYYENIKNEIIEICDYEIQCKIAEYIKFITSKIETEKELLNKLYLQKAYLLRNLFI